MSCVFSTHHFLRTLNSFPSLLQRISLALSPLLLLRALPEPRLFFLLYNLRLRNMYGRLDLLNHGRLSLPNHGHVNNLAQELQLWKVIVFGHDG